MPHYIRAVCFDCGDTIIDEATEIKRPGSDITIRAELIPGADQALHELKRRGYPLALVADGPVETFRNALNQHGLYDLFDAYAISSEVGVDKPHPRMFLTALEQLHVAPEDYKRVIMVGNYLARDIKGANQVGLISVWLNWSPRRPKVPADNPEVPCYTITMPLQLLSVIESLEKENQ